MSKTTFTDMTMRTRSNACGVVRNSFGRAMEARERQMRRHSASITAFYGAERLDMSLIERRSLLDAAAPERC